MLKRLIFVDKGSWVNISRQIGLISRGLKPQTKQFSNDSTQLDMSEVNSLDRKRTRQENIMQSKDSSTVLRFHKLSESARTPTRGSKLSAGYDLYSAKSCTIPAKDKLCVATDLQIELPNGCYGRVAPRSGLAVKHFIDVGAGVIDQDYRGPVGVVMFNFNDKDFEVKGGDRIAQLVCERIYLPDLKESELSETVVSLTEANGSGDKTNGTSESGDKTNGQDATNGTSKSDEKTNGKVNSPDRKRPRQEGLDSNKVLRYHKLSELAHAPKRGSTLAAGFELYSAKSCTIPANGKLCVATDLQIELPDGCYGRVAPQSDSEVASKHFIDVGAGVIDQDYRGPVGVVMFNFNDKDFEVKEGDQIAQLICESIFLPDLEESADKLSETARGAGGFGSTGVSLTETSKSDDKTNGQEISSDLKRSRQENIDSNKVLKYQKLSDLARAPTRGSTLAAGFDLYSAKSCTIPAKGKLCVATDLQIELPDGCYGRLAPRSGLAVKHFIDVGAGVIDQDYRGPVGVVMFNFNDKDFEVKEGDRIAQLVCERIFSPDLEESKLSETARGAGGFGSTGVSLKETNGTSKSEDKTNGQDATNGTSESDNKPKEQEAAKGNDNTKATNGTLKSDGKTNEQGTTEATNGIQQESK